MVGQRFVALLADHPWFEVTTVAASPSSAGKSYGDAVAGRWTMPSPVPAATAKLTVGNASDVASIASQVATLKSAEQVIIRVEATSYNGYGKILSANIYHLSKYKYDALMSAGH